MWFSRPLSSLASLAALLGSFSVGGCAYQLNSLAAKSATDVGSKHDAKPPEVDLAYARAVAAAALARDDKDNSTTWHNPNTGAGGYITARFVVYRGHLHLPRFPRELRARANRGLAAGRGLPYRSWQVGGKEPGRETVARPLLNPRLMIVVKPCFFRHVSQRSLQQELERGQQHRKEREYQVRQPDRLLLPVPDEVLQDAADTDVCEA